MLIIFHFFRRPPQVPLRTMWIGIRFCTYVIWP